MREENITPNFKWREFIRDEDTIPAPYVLDNLRMLANRLQVVRDILGKPINITSGYRTESHNKAIGGSKNSYHLRGLAADVSVSSMAAPDVQKFLKDWSGGLGSYSTWTHLDIRPIKARW